MPRPAALLRVSSGSGAVPPRFSFRHAEGRRCFALRRDLLLPPGKGRDSTPLFFSSRRKEKRRGRWKRKGRFSNPESLDHSTRFSAAFAVTSLPPASDPALSASLSATAVGAATPAERAGIFRAPGREVLLVWPPVEGRFRPPFSFFKRKRAAAGPKENFFSNRDGLDHSTRHHLLSP